MLKHHCGVILAVLVMSSPCGAQRPQDNWYYEATWWKTNALANGGLQSQPFGVAVGLDRRVYVAVEGSSPRVQVYLPDGTFSFSITNTTGPLATISDPTSLCVDGVGNLYVVDAGPRCVYVFSPNGAYIRTIGNAVTNQYCEVRDVAVAKNGDVYLLDGTCYWVTVFAADGTFLRRWGGSGTLDGFLAEPVSIAVSPDDRVYICERQSPPSSSNIQRMKVFDKYGFMQKKIDMRRLSGGWTFGPCAVRMDPAGNAIVLLAAPGESGGSGDGTPSFEVYNPDLQLVAWIYKAGLLSPYDSSVGSYPCMGIGPDGTVIVSSRPNKCLWLYRSAHRELRVAPENCYPFPSVLGASQREMSPLIDVDYRVTDADDSNVTAAVLIFTNGTQSVSGCLRNPTFVEGTATNIGGGIAANQDHRLTWNAGSDWATTLGNFRVAVLAMDGRTNLLDIHYLRLPADRGMPELKISRSPLLQNDFMQVWWWQLATNDPGIQILSSKIYGVSGIYSNQVLNDGTNTTALGRGYIYQQMHLREATAQEVAWAKEASTPGATNVWGVTRSVGGRPVARNEYGFDTGVGGTNVWWVVPQP